MTTMRITVFPRPACCDHCASMRAPHILFDHSDHVPMVLCAACIGVAVQEVRAAETGVSDVPRRKSRPAIDPEILAAEVRQSRKGDKTGPKSAGRRVS
jgi:hypothetical protein